MTLQTPTFTTDSDAKKFFVDVGEGDDKERRMIRFTRNVVIVTTAFGDKVAFMKTNRSQNFRDSREKPNKLIGAQEVLEELRRLLCCERKALDAFQALAT